VSLLSPTETHSRVGLPAHALFEARFTGILDQIDEHQFDLRSVASDREIGTAGAVNLNPRFECGDAGFPTA